MPEENKLPSGNVGESQSELVFQADKVGQPASKSEIDFDEIESLLSDPKPAQQEDIDFDEIQSLLETGRKPIPGVKQEQKLSSKDEAAAVFQKLKAAPEDDAAKIMQEFDRPILEDAYKGFFFGMSKIVDTMQLPLTFTMEKMFGEQFDLNWQQFYADPNNEPGSATFKAFKTAGETTIMSLLLGPLFSKLRVPTPGAPKPGVIGPQAKPGVTRRLGQFVKKTLKAGGEAQARAPFAQTGLEALGGLGAGFGGAVAVEKFPDSDLAEFFGQIAGGTAVSLVPFSPTARGVKWLYNKARHPFTPVGSRNRAIDRIKREVADARKAVQSIDDPGLLPAAEEIATNAQKSQDPLLMQIHRALLRLRDDAPFQADEELAQFNRAIIESLEAPPSKIETTRRSLEHAQNSLMKGIELRMKTALVQADEAMKKAGPKLKIEDANRITRDLLADVLDEARADETTLWNLVPENIKRSSFASANKWKALLQEAALVEDPDVFRLSGKDPDVLFRTLGSVNPKTGKFSKGTFKKLQNVKELKALRSRILREIRAEEAALATGSGNRNKIRVLGEVQEALLNDMATPLSGEPDEAGEALLLAIKYSRSLNETFSRKPISSILATTKTGAPVTPPTIALDTALVGSGGKPAETAKTLLKAAQFEFKEAGLEPKDIAQRTETLMGSIESWVKSRFYQSNAVVGDTINPRAGQAFIDKNRRFLKEFPEILDDLQKAVDSSSTATLRTNRFKSVGDRLQNPSVSKAALFIKKPTNKAFQEIIDMRPNERVNAINNLIKQTKRDQSGEALEGLQRGFLDWVLQKSRISPESIQKATRLGDPYISGLMMRRTMATDGVEEIMNRLLTSEQKKRLSQAIKTANVIDNELRAKVSVEGVLADEPGVLTTLFARLFGAARGGELARATGTGGIQMQAILSQATVKALRSVVRDPAAKIIEDAFMLDDGGELLKALLTETITEESRKFVIDTVQSWAGATLFELGEKTVMEFDEEE